MNIRINMTKEDIFTNMVEIAAYLAQKEDDVNSIDIEFQGLNMHFEAWTDENV